MEDEILPVIETSKTAQAELPVTVPMKLPPPPPLEQKKHVELKKVAELRKPVEVKKPAEPIQPKDLRKFPRINGRLKNHI